VKHGGTPIAPARRCGVTSTLIVKQDDRPSPRLIAASPPDVSHESIHLIGELTFSTSEMHTLDSFSPSELVASEGNRPHPVIRVSVHPTDGDPYTRSCAKWKYN
jgi:hypothetical protein